MRKKMRIQHVSALAVLFLANITVTHAEIIRLKNGTRIDGKVLEISASKVVVETDGIRLSLRRDQVLTPDEKLLDGARTALNQRKYDIAKKACIEFLRWHSNHTEAQQLLAKIEASIEAAKWA